jgi:hypothetical protein
MNGNLSRVLRPGLFLGLALAATVVTVALAGGFYLSVERPAGADPAFQHAALVVRTLGCKDPSQAKLTVRAEGIVDGQRRSQPLALRSVSQGVFAVDRAWPAEGTWVVAITATYNGVTREVLADPAADRPVLAESVSRRAVDSALAAAVRTAAASGGTH